MAENLTTATINVRGNTRGLEKDILKSLRDIEFSQINTKKSSQALGRITGQVSEFNKSLEASNARVIAFGASAGAIFAVERAFASLISSTIEVEKKLTDINVLLNVSSSQLEKFGDSLFGIARNTAQSFSVVADAAAELARQGLGIEETLKRTNAALILTRLSGLDAKSSVEALTATLNSFSGAALDAAEVVNKLANVDAAFAVSSADLANGIARVGSTAQDAGVSLDELLALVTTAQQITSRGGAVIGNSFKTIFTRLQRGSVKDALAELGIDTSETQNAVGLLRQLADVYDTLGATQKASVAESVGGVFQINILKAALSDLGREYSIYNRALDISLSSTDEAIRRNELLNQTVSALSTQAFANLEQAANKIGSLVFTPNAKGFLSGFNDILSAFNNVDSESAGGKLMEGFFKGIGNFISGPGAVLATAVLVKLFAKLSQFAAGSARELLGTNKAAQQQAAIEQSILSILQKNSQFTSQILSGKMTTVQAEKELLNYLRAQSNILREQERLSKIIGSNLRMAGVSIGASGIPMVGGATGKKAAASGFVPSFASDMAIGQAMENAGARQHGYKAGKARKTTIHDGNGKSFTSFVNSREDVKTFTNAAGKKATIVRPPNGFGENTQFAAGGFVPNFIKESIAERNRKGLDLERGINFILSGIYKDAGSDLLDYPYGGKLMSAPAEVKSRAKINSLSRYGDAKYSNSKTNVRDFIKKITGSLDKKNIVELINLANKTKLQGINLNRYLPATPSLLNWGEQKDSRKKAATRLSTVIRNLARLRNDNSLPKLNESGSRVKLFLDYLDDKVYYKKGFDEPSVAASGFVPNFARASDLYKRIKANEGVTDPFNKEKNKKGSKRDLGSLPYTMIHGGSGVLKEGQFASFFDKKKNIDYQAKINVAGINSSKIKNRGIETRVGEALVTETNDLVKIFNPGAKEFSSPKQLANAGSVGSAAGTVFESAIRSAFQNEASGPESQTGRIDFPAPSEALRGFFYNSPGPYEAKINDSLPNRSSALSKWVAVNNLAGGFLPKGLVFSKSKKDEFGFETISAKKSGKKVGSIEYFEDLPGVVETGSFSVDKQFRGMGIGRSLYQEMLKRNAGKKITGQLLPQTGRFLEKLKRGEKVSVETLYPQMFRAGLGKDSVFEVYGHKGMDVEKMSRQQFTSFVNAKIKELQNDPRKFKQFFGDIGADPGSGLGVKLDTQHSAGFVPNFLDIKRGGLPVGVRGRVNFGSAGSKSSIQLGVGAEPSTLAHELFHSAYSRSTFKKSRSNEQIGKFISEPRRYTGSGFLIGDKIFKNLNKKNLIESVGLNPIQLDFDGRNPGATYSGEKAIDEIITRIQEKVFKNRGDLDSLSVDEKTFTQNLQNLGIISGKRLSNISRRSKEGSRFRSLVEGKFSSVMGGASSGFVPNFAQFSNQKMFRGIKGWGAALPTALEQGTSGGSKFKLGSADENDVVMTLLGSNFAIGEMSPLIAARAGVEEHTTIGGGMGMGLKKLHFRPDYIVKGSLSGKALNVPYKNLGKMARNIFKKNGVENDFNELLRITESQAYDISNGYQPQEDPRLSSVSAKLRGILQSGINRGGKLQGLVSKAPEKDDDYGSTSYFAPFSYGKSQEDFQKQFSIKGAYDREAVYDLSSLRPSDPLLKAMGSIKAGTFKKWGDPEVQSKIKELRSNGINAQLTRASGKLSKFSGISSGAFGFVPNFADSVRRNIYDWDGTIIPKISGNAEEYIGKLSSLGEKDLLPLGKKLKSGNKKFDIFTARPPIFDKAITDTANRLGLPFNKINFGIKPKDKLAEAQNRKSKLIDDDLGLLGKDRFLNARRLNKRLFSGFVANFAASPISPKAYYSRAGQSWLKGVEMKPSFDPVSGISFPDFDKKKNRIKKIVHAEGVEGSNIYSPFQFEDLIGQHRYNLNFWKRRSFEYISNSAGFVPNFADALKAAIEREKSAGLSSSQIYVDEHSSLKNKNNPMGLMVANTRDEPRGGIQGIKRAKKEGRNPKKYGAASSGFIPNFAPGPIQPSQDYINAMNEALRAVTSSANKASSSIKKFDKEVSDSADSVDKSSKKEGKLSKLGGFIGRNSMSLGFGLQTAASMAGEYAGNDDTKTGRGIKAAAGGIGDIASFTGTGAMIAGPWGAAAGFAVGLGKAALDLTKALTTKVPDLEKALQVSSDSMNRFGESGQKILQLNEQYSEALKSGNPSQAADIMVKTQQAYAEELSKLTESQRSILISAIAQGKGQEGYAKILSELQDSAKAQEAALTFQKFQESGGPFGGPDKRIVEGIDKSLVQDLTRGLDAEGIQKALDNAANVLQDPTAGTENQAIALMRSLASSESLSADQKANFEIIIDSFANAAADTDLSKVAEGFLKGVAGKPKSFEDLQKAQDAAKAAATAEAEKRRKEIEIREKANASLLKLQSDTENIYQRFNNSVEDFISSMETMAEMRSAAGEFRAGFYSEGGVPSAAESQKEKNILSASRDRLNVDVKKSQFEASNNFRNGVETLLEGVTANAAKLRLGETASSQENELLGIRSSLEQALLPVQQMLLGGQYEAARGETQRVLGGLSEEQKSAIGSDKLVDIGIQLDRSVQESARKQDLIYKNSQKDLAIQAQQLVFQKAMSKLAQAQAFGGGSVRDILTDSSDTSFNQATQAVEDLKTLGYNQRDLRQGKVSAVRGGDAESYGIRGEKANTAMLQGLIDFYGAASKISGEPVLSTQSKDFGVLAQALSEKIRKEMDELRAAGEGIVDPVVFARLESTLNTLGGEDRVAQLKIFKDLGVADVGGKQILDEALKSYTGGAFAGLSPDLKKAFESTTDEGAGATLLLIAGQEKQTDSLSQGLAAVTAAGIEGNNLLAAQPDAIAAAIGAVLEAGRTEQNYQAELSKSKELEKQYSDMSTQLRGLDAEAKTKKSELESARGQLAALGVSESDYTNEKELEKAKSLVGNYSRTEGLTKTDRFRKLFAGMAEQFISFDMEAAEKYYAMADSDPKTLEAEYDKALALIQASELASTVSQKESELKEVQTKSAALSKTGDEIIVKQDEQSKKTVAAGEARRSAASKAATAKNLTTTGAGSDYIANVQSTMAARAQALAATIGVDDLSKTKKQKEAIARSTGAQLTWNQSGGRQDTFENVAITKAGGANVEAFTNLIEQNVLPSLKQFSKVYESMGVEGGAKAAFEKQKAEMFGIQKVGPKLEPPSLVKPLALPPEQQRQIAPPEQQERNQEQIQKQTEIRQEESQALGSILGAVNQIAQIITNPQQGVAGAQGNGSQPGTVSTQSVGAGAVNVSTPVSLTVNANAQAGGNAEAAAIAEQIKAGISSFLSSPEFISKVTSIANQAAGNKVPPKIV